ncbi:hypothetical protein BVC80_1315g18 [Macleaya cordata]|uniref:RNase H type-1 domain-containing protein n=1 Tax=Macleaya cordata TaxID=56857 RepID=A0A200QZ13_MACCD|nr:hypothetical protein BVC80_1315g18 [Macleaya cordata]
MAMEFAFGVSRMRREGNYLFAWIPPPDSYWKLNIAEITEANCSSTGVASILRDDFGGFKGAVADTIKDVSQEFAALWAINIGLSLAMRLGVEYLEVEGHSPFVLTLMIGSTEPSPNCLQLFNHIWDLMRHFKGIKLHQVFPDVNEAATLLAEHAGGLTSPVEFVRPPSYLVSVLQEDMLGRPVLHQARPRENRN